MKALQNAIQNERESERERERNREREGIREGRTQVGAAAEGDRGTEREENERRNKE